MENEQNGAAVPAPDGRMSDGEIVALYLDRDERAIGATQEKYGRYCYSIAYSILHCREDAEECENDTYLGLWNAIPPHRPQVLATFLGKLVRRISIHKWREGRAEKRGGGELPLTLDELGDCIPDGETLDCAVEDGRITEVIDRFLRTLSADERDAFLLRYWYVLPVKEVARRLGYGESRVKMMLLRTRERLRTRLTEEGITL